MSVMRGVAPFEQLWQRRMTVEDASGLHVELIGLADLVQAKKTQRDKDWPMLRRLVESHFHQNRSRPTPEQVDFWLLECRTPSILIGLAREHSGRAAELAGRRPLLTAAARADESALTGGLHAEEQREREADRVYWAPLRAELGWMRRLSRGRSEGR
jgi:hypothetical protein